ncbi:hypothetical protein HK405_006736 [Cladochytrium tenue]|nr:hypothetical protein HK405_006736 [Cladochytrium tenue]
MHAASGLSSTAVAATPSHSLLSAPSTGPFTSTTAAAASLLPPLPPSPSLSRPATTGSPRTSLEEDRQPTPRSGSVRPRRAWQMAAGSGRDAIRDPSPSGGSPFYDSAPAFITVSEISPGGATAPPPVPLPYTPRQVAAAATGPTSFAAGLRGPPQFADAELWRRAKDELFWKRLLIQDSTVSAQGGDVADILQEMNVSLVLASHFKIHELNGEVESLRSYHARRLGKGSRDSLRSRSPHPINTNLDASPLRQLRNTSQHRSPLPSPAAIARTASPDRFAVSHHTAHASLSPTRASGAAASEPVLSHNNQGDIAELRDREQKWRNKYKKVAARCLELRVELDRAHDDLAMFSETNRTLAPLLSHRRSEAGLPKFLKAIPVEGALSAKTRHSTESQPATEAVMGTSPGTSDLLVALVRELASSKKKMHGELDEMRSLLQQSQGEVAYLKEKLELGDRQKDEFDDFSGQRSVFGELEDYIASRSADRGAFARSDGDILGERRTMAVKTEGTNTDGVNVQQKKIIDDAASEDGWDLASNFSITDDALSPTSKGVRSAPTVAENEADRGRTEGPSRTDLSSLPSPTQIYLRTLHSMAVALHERLNATDTVALNRMLRREFDIMELTRLSQSVIANISSDVKNLSSRFPLSVEPRPVRGGKSQLTAPISSSDLTTTILPMVSLIQALLSDIGVLRSTLNDLSLAFYDKMMEQSKQAEISATTAATDAAAQLSRRGSGRRTLVHKISVEQTSDGGGSTGSRGRTFEWLRGLAISSDSAPPLPSEQQHAGGGNWTWRPWGGTGGDTSSRSASVDSWPRASLTSTRTHSAAAPPATADHGAAEQATVDVRSDMDAPQNRRMASSPVRSPAAAAPPLPGQEPTGSSLRRSNSVAGAGTVSGGDDSRRGRQGRPAASAAAAAATQADGWAAVTEALGALSGRTESQSSYNPHLPPTTTTPPRAPVAGRARQSAAGTAVPAASSAVPAMGAAGAAAAPPSPSAGGGGGGPSHHPPPINFAAFGEAWQKWGASRWSGPVERPGI